MDYQSGGNGNPSYPGNYNRTGRGGRGRYANQGNYNNRVQGGNPPGGPLSAEEYKQRSVMRANEYKKQMRIYLGEQQPDQPGGKQESMNTGRYCIIHDSRTHATADCFLLRDDAPAAPGNGGAGSSESKQVTFAPTPHSSGNPGN